MSKSTGRFKESRQWKARTRPVGGYQGRPRGKSNQRGKEELSVSESKGYK